MCINAYATTLTMATQLSMIENTCLVKSFPHEHDNTIINNRCDDFRKKQDILNPHTVIGIFILKFLAFIHMIIYSKLRRLVEN